VRSTIIVLTALSFAAPAWAGKKDVETPAEAVSKAKKAEKNQRHDFWVVRSLDDSLDEKSSSILLGRKKVLPYEFVNEQGRVEIIVDSKRLLYKDRKYKGIIPGIRNTMNARQFLRRRGKHYITWVGFQPMPAISRLFWKVTDPYPRFHVNRIDSYTVEVVFPNGKVPNRNTVRPLITRYFGGPIDRVIGKRSKRGIRYLIKTKRPANYLFRFQAPYLYVDFER
jgi:hypothetical protein